jgi:dephospho-CoA kinase
VPVLGITGGIATGKTTFTGCLSSLRPELEVFDSDSKARELTGRDAAILAEIREEFGPGVFDASGTLQRPALRAIVFAEPVKRKALEAILHPAIRRAWLELAENIRGRPGRRWLAVDIPLLFETSAENHFDKVIVVACSPATQRRRLMENRTIAPSLAESIIGSQLPLAAKVERADCVVWNDGGLEAVRAQARLLSMHLLS